MTLTRIEADGSQSVWYTLAHAAQAIGKREATLQKWIRDGDLTAHTHDLIPGVVLIEERDLWEAERAVAARAGASTRFGTTSSQVTRRRDTVRSSSVQCPQEAPAARRLSA